MKQLVCEMCGSADLVKDGGVFVCQSCGCKYSVEEAKKMMVEGVVQVTGTVKVDKTDQIDTFLEMALNALDAGNLSEADVYCNKIIEIEPNNYKAWFNKAKAVGWQSTLANPRISETVNAFSKALDNAPEEEKIEIAKQAKEELKKLFSSMLSLRMGQFEKYPRIDDVAGLQHDANEIVTIGMKFLLKTGLTAEVFSYEYGAIICSGVMKAAVASHNRFNSDSHPSEHDAYRYWEEGEVLIKALEVGLSLCDSSLEDKNSNEVMISIYDAMIKIMQSMMNITVYKPYYKDGRRHYSVCIDFNFKRTAQRQERIKQWQAKIEQIKSEGSRKASEAEKRKKEAEQRIRDKYWADHSDEKAALDNEAVDLNNEKKGLDEILRGFESEKQGFSNLSRTITPTESIIAEINREITGCQLERKNAGLFKFDEKKAIDARIRYLESRRQAITGQAQAERSELQNYINVQVNGVLEKMKPSQSRVNEITKRLSEISKTIEYAGGSIEKARNTGLPIVKPSAEQG